MGELPKSPHVGCSQDLLVGEVGDTIAIINTDITSIFKENRTRKAGVPNKSRSVDYVPEGLLEVDLLNPRSILHKKSIVGSKEPSSKYSSINEGEDRMISGASDNSVGLRIPGTAESEGGIKIHGMLGNRRGSLDLLERGSGSGRSRTNTMPSLNSKDTTQKSENEKSSMKDEKDSQPIVYQGPCYQKSQSMVETIKAPEDKQSYQKSQSLVETPEDKQMFGSQKSELDERSILSTPSLSTQTPTRSKKISEVLMSSWFFQRKQSENDLKSLAEENNQEENETDKVDSVKNNVNFSHSDIGDKKMSLSNFVAGNFTARDLRSLNAFVPQST